MNRLPPDQPDDHGPTIPARFRVYPEPRQSDGKALRRIALALAALGLLAFWAFA